MRPTTSGTTRLRVMHVASGGFSGATQVALDLTRHAEQHDCLLVLRRKRRTPMARVRALQEQGVPLAVVNGWTHWSTVLELARLCQRWRPDVVVGHGFPEHLLARWAAWWASRGAARPIVLVQVEHNMRERYTPFKRWQVAQLKSRTAAFVGVSQAVADELCRMGLPAPKVHTIHNGIALSAFADSQAYPWPERDAAILMAARFGAQKDHETLIRALVPLATGHGLKPKLRLAGSGSRRHRERSQQLVQALGLQDQVEFLGHRSDLPALLMQHRVAALSTHYEGLPLILAEAMAAGCAVVGSDVPAVRETLGDEQWGWLARPGDAAHWAHVLAPLLRASRDLHPGSVADVDQVRDAAAIARRADEARSHAREHLQVQRMVCEHEALQASLCHPSHSNHPPRTGAPGISILMPAHNACAHVGEALASILHQLGPNDEVVVIDDGSTDDTAQRIGALAHPQLRLLRHAEALGVSQARNALLQAAQGEWIWFIDADDRMRPGALQRVRTAIDQALTPVPALDMILLDHAVLRDRPRFKHRLRGEHHRASFAGRAGVPLTPQELLRGALARAQWHPWGRVVRRAAWPPELRFPMGRCFEDLSVVPRLLSHCRAAWWINEPLIDYRSSPTSILGTMNAGKVEDWAQALLDLARVPADRHDQSSTHQAWRTHLAVQAVRMASVAHRMGIPEAQWRNWLHQLATCEPMLWPEIRRWPLMPGRLGLALKARRLGLPPKEPPP